MRVVLKAVSEMARLGANHCICWDPCDTLYARAAVAKTHVLHINILTTDGTHVSYTYLNIFLVTERVCRLVSICVKGRTISYVSGLSR